VLYVLGKAIGIAKKHSINKVSIVVIVDKFKIMRTGPENVTSLFVWVYLFGFTVTVLGPGRIILNLPTIMTIETLLIECFFAIHVALPNIEPFKNSRKNSLKTSRVISKIRRIVLSRMVKIPLNIPISVS